jgi:hypothetical protein
MTLERWTIGDLSVTKVFETMLDQYDNDCAEAVRSVESLLDLAVERSALIFGTHFPTPTTGRLRRNTDTLEWLPC